MNRPNFFIVGAAKCGTTSMYEYLRQHPDVFMPEFKEPIFFGQDLDIAPCWCVRDERDYLALFDQAGGKKRIGESSVWYICSRSAPDEIRRFNPDAKVVIMLRHPVEFLYSLHGLFLWTDNEDIADFEQAFFAQDDRRHGRRIPDMAYFQQGLQYTQMAAFSEQVQRYRDVFPASQVHVILHDDLKKDLSGVYRRLLEFLDLDSTFQPEFRMFNETRAVRHVPFHRFFNRPRTRRRIQKTAPAISRILRRKLADLLIFLFRPPYRSPKIDAAVRARLTPLFEDEIQRLGRLLGRDLSHWLAPAEPRKALASQAAAGH
jgi:hypothetical protein